MSLSPSGGFLKVESQSRSHALYETKLEALHQHANKLADARDIEEITKYTIDAVENTRGFSWASFGIVEDNLLKFTLWALNAPSQIMTGGEKSWKFTHALNSDINSYSMRRNSEV